MFCCSQVLMFFFFFKQKTAYEMRISDWSSDVCSSDLDDAVGDDGHDQPASLDPEPCGPVEPSSVQVVDDLGLSSLQRSGLVRSGGLLGRLLVEGELRLLQLSHPAAGEESGRVETDQGNLAPPVCEHLDAVLELPALLATDHFGRESGREK